MKGRNWLSLALASLVLFYAMYLALEVMLRTMCGQLGYDYCDFVSAGIVANRFGYVRIYDLQVLDQVQKSLLPANALRSSIPVNIFPYLPVFVLPFQPLALLPPEISFWIWTALNVAALVLYLQFFSHDLGLRPGAVPMLLLVFASLPVFQCVFGGQVNIWLTICTGEFMRAMLNRRPFRAGLWLGGFLVKPQALILIGAALLLRRCIRVLGGLAVAALVLAALSVALIGASGMGDLLDLWLLYLRGHPSNLVHGMANWRMIGQQLSSLTNVWIGYSAAAMGIVATLLLAFPPWRHPMDLTSPAFIKPLLGMLAATTMVAWHSHIYMATILIPPMVYLYSTRALSEEVLACWVLPPAVVYFVSVFVPEATASLDLHVVDIGAAIYVVLGLVQFAANAYLLCWSCRSSPRPDSIATQVTGSNASPD